jgi:hypothetical protein
MTRLILIAPHGSDLRRRVSPVLRDIQEATLGLVERLHLGPLALQRLDLILHLLDLDVGQLVPEHLDFIFQLVDPAALLNRGSFRVLSIGFGPIPPSDGQKFAPGWL